MVCQTIYVTTYIISHINMPFLFLFLASIFQESLDFISLADCSHVDGTHFGVAHLNHVIHSDHKAVVQFSVISIYSRYITLITWPSLFGNMLSSSSPCLKSHLQSFPVTQIILKCLVVVVVSHGDWNCVILEWTY